MAEKTYVLQAAESVVISAAAAGKLMDAGDGDAALLYIYLAQNGGSFRTEAAALRLGKSEKQISEALQRLESAGLIASGGRAEPAVTPPLREENTLPEYAVSDIKREMENGTVFPLLVRETERRMGKTLTTADLTILFGIYDYLRLPPEIILQLVTFCIDETKARYGSTRVPSMRAVEKIAFKWERAGITTLEQAEQYIKALESRRSAEREIMAALQITDRSLAPGERRFVESWLDMGFGAEAAAMAYDKTVLRTGRRSWKYMDTIMRNWYSKGMITPESIRAGDAKENPPRQEMPAATDRGGSAPQAEDYERMKKMLEKMKGE